jgi:hypothetical protein
MFFQQWNALRSVSNIIPAIIILASLCLPSSWLIAADLVDLALTQNKGVYQLRLEIILDATPRNVHDVLTDYAHIYRINPSIIDSEILHSPDDSVVRVRTVINDCILVFCKVLHRVEEVRELETGDIYALVDPELSNVKSGVTIWQINAMGSRTRINYTLSVEPDFFVPPLIGTHVVKQKIKREVLMSLENIERIAQINDSDIRASQ